MPRPNRLEDKKSARQANLTMRFTQFRLPPVQDALVIGRRAPVGANAIGRAFQEMVPGIYRLIKMDHSVVEAVMIRESDLQKIPETELVPRILRQVDKLMGDTDTLHVAIGIEIVTEERVEL
ncbi:MAG: hypothetical protein HYU36_15970 [Planctomycetes bacterium]|nr:hypothetical protein [Planctomycetota bacterium]